MFKRHLKSRDLGPERSRCADESCPQWQSGCARAEHQEGRGEFLWLAVGQRYHEAKRCKRHIDPVTMEEGACAN